jgi:hypothetical protein
MKEKQQLLQRQEILQKLRFDIFGVEEKTKHGNIISNAFWGFWPTGEERYLNPKMEDELVIFKKKIAGRFESRDISTQFEFPRIGSQLHQKLNYQYNFLDSQNAA